MLVTLWSTRLRFNLVPIFQNLTVKLTGTNTRAITETVHHLSNILYDSNKRFCWLLTMGKYCPLLKEKFCYIYNPWPIGVRSESWDCTFDFNKVTWTWKKTTRQPRSPCLIWSEMECTFVRRLAAFQSNCWRILQIYDIFVFDIIFCQFVIHSEKIVNI